MSDPKTMQLSVDFPHLCEIILEADPHLGVAYGLQLTCDILNAIAKRAEEIGNTEILDLLKRLGAK